MPCHLFFRIHVVIIGWKGWAVKFEGIANKIVNCGGVRKFHRLEETSWGWGRGFENLRFEICDVARVPGSSNNRPGGDIR